MSRVFQLVLQLTTSARAWNIALRTAHIAMMGLLLGGYAYDVAPERLHPALWACVATGAALMLSETGFATPWFHELRGLATMGKLLLIAMVPLFWDHRLAVLMVVVVIASVGSHMPARFRHYSVLFHKVIYGSCGPAGGRSLEDLEAEPPAESACRKTTTAPPCPAPPCPGPHDTADS